MTPSGRFGLSMVVAGLCLAGARGAQARCSQDVLDEGQLLLQEWQELGSESGVDLGDSITLLSRCLGSAEVAAATPATHGATLSLAQGYLYSRQFEDADTWLTALQASPLATPDVKGRAALLRSQVLYQANGCYGERRKPNDDGTFSFMSASCEEAFQEAASARAIFETALGGEPSPGQAPEGGPESLPGYWIKTRTWQAEMDWYSAAYKEPADQVQGKEGYAQLVDLIAGRFGSTSSSATPYRALDAIDPWARASVAQALSLASGAVVAQEDKADLSEADRDQLRALCAPGRQLENVRDEGICLDRALDVLEGASDPELRRRVEDNYYRYVVTLPDASPEAYTEAMNHWQARITVLLDEQRAGRWVSGGADAAAGPAFPGLQAAVYAGRSAVVALPTYATPIEEVFGASNQAEVAHLVQGWLEGRTVDNRDLEYRRAVALAYSYVIEAEAVSEASPARAAAAWGRAWAAVEALDRTPGLDGAFNPDREDRFLHEQAALRLARLRLAGIAGALGDSPRATWRGEERTRKAALDAIWAESQSYLKATLSACNYNPEKG